MHQVITIKINDLTWKDKKILTSDFFLFLGNESILEKNTTGQCGEMTWHQDVQSKDRRGEARRQSSHGIFVHDQVHSCISTWPSSKFSAAENHVFLSITAACDNPFEQVSSRKKTVR